MSSASAQLLLELVRTTGRASALLFATALALPALHRGVARRRADLFLLFVFAQTVHFAVVASYAIAVPGAALFPGSRDLAAAGGWPAVFGVFVIFYLPALFALGARRMGTGAPRWLEAAGRGSTLFIAFMFVATYVPLFERSWLYAAPAAAVLAGVLLDVLKGAPAGSPGQRSC